MEIFHGSVAEGVRRAVAVLKRGGVVAHATDTVWGLAADASNAKAIAKVHAIKHSDSTKPLLVIVPTKAYASKITTIPSTAKVLMRNFWPGALAVVLKIKSPQPPIPPACGHPPYRRGAMTGGIGVRYPAHALSVALARGLGRPITTTSANPTGVPPAHSAAEVLELFTDVSCQPDLVLDCSDSKKSRPEKTSTIVDCTVMPPRIVREGAVSAREIAAALSRLPSRRG